MRKTMLALATTVPLLCAQAGTARAVVVNVPGGFDPSNGLAEFRPIYTGTDQLTSVSYRVGINFQETVQTNNPTFRLVTEVRERGFILYRDNHEVFGSQSSPGVSSYSTGISISENSPYLYAGDGGTNVFVSAYLTDEGGRIFQGGTYQLSASNVSLTAYFNEPPLIATPIPEPATMTLMFAALGGVLLMRPKFR